MLWLRQQNAENWLNKSEWKIYIEKYGTIINIDIRSCRGKCNKCEMIYSMIGRCA